MTNTDQMDTLDTITTDLDLLAELIGEDEVYDDTADIAELDELLVPVSFAD